MTGTGYNTPKQKGKIRKQYYRRIRMVTKSELNAINRVEAINTPLVAYSFNIVDWKMEEIRQLDRKTRKLITHLTKDAPHSKADMDRMYLPRNEGYRGLIQLETAHKTATIRLDTCFNTKNDPFLVIAKEHEKTKTETKTKTKQNKTRQNKKRTKKKYSVPSQATILRRELNLPETLEPGCWIWAGSVITSDGASASGIIVLFSKTAHKISIYLPDFIYFSASKNVISHICV